MAAKRQMREARRWRMRLAPVLHGSRQAAVLLPLLLVVALGGWWLSRPEHLPVTRVGVHSPLQHVDRAALQRALEPHLGGGFLYVDMGALQEAVQALPWVYRASVRRAWPDAIEVRVEEQRALARWRDGGLVNADGERFESAGASVGAGLPVLAGPAGSEALLVERYRELQRLLAPLGVGMAELTLSERRAWSLLLDNGVRVILGRGALPERVLRLVRVWRGRLAPRLADIEQVDMRYTNGFAVRWREGAVAEPERTA